MRSSSTRPPQFVGEAEIIDHQSAGLVLEHAIDPRDRLHQTLSERPPVELVRDPYKLPPVHLDPEVLDYLAERARRGESR